MLCVRLKPTEMDYFNLSAELKTSTRMSSWGDPDNYPLDISPGLFPMAPFYVNVKIPSGETNVGVTRCAT